jgi:hypothetical protein
MGPRRSWRDHADMTQARSPFTGGADLLLGAILTTTRPVKASVDTRLGRRSMVVESGVHLRHAGTTRFGEHDTALEYADVYLRVLDGRHAGKTVILWTFDNAQPVDVPALVALDHGLTSV